MAENTTKLSAKRPELAKHDIKLLDLAFAMDCTGSMGSYIDSARDNVRKIVEEIVASEKGDVRLALVEYRDHPPQDSTFVTRVHDFTTSPGTMKKWLSECSANGGGDAPEAVADALHDLLKLNWREEATKICVCISDAPPHGLESNGDSFPNGCPAGIDPMVVVNELAEKGITLYVAGCEPAIRQYKEFFMAIAHITGGQYVPLTKAHVLTKVIVGGAQEEMSLEQFMAEVDEEVQAEVAAGREINEDEITRMVHGKMRSKGIRTKQLQMNNVELMSATDSALAKKFCNMKSMAAVRQEQEASNPAPQQLQAMPMRKSARRSVPMAAPMMLSEACAPPPPGALGGFMESNAHESYDTVEQEISYNQASRMVQKSMARNFAKKK